MAKEFINSWFGKLAEKPAAIIFEMGKEMKGYRNELTAMRKEFKADLEKLENKKLSVDVKVTGSSGGVTIKLSSGPEAPQWIKAFGLTALFLTLQKVYDALSEMDKVVSAAEKTKAAADKATAFHTWLKDKGVYTAIGKRIDGIKEKLKKSELIDPEDASC